MDNTKVNPNTSDFGPIERRSVAMWPEQWQIVEDLSRWFGMGNVSVALRFIVTDYNRLVKQNEPSTTTAAGATTAQ